MDYENALAVAGGLTLDYRSAAEIPPSYNVTPTNMGWIARSNDQNVQK
jgi:hypothetical protein